MTLNNDSDWQWMWWKCWGRYPDDYPGTPFLQQVSQLHRHVPRWYNAEHSGLYLDRVSDLWVLVFAAIGFGMMRLATKHWLFPRLARAVGIYPHYVAKTNKFSYQLWLVLYYGAMCVLGVYFMNLVPWGRNPFSCSSQVMTWKDHPYRGVPRSFELYYLAQGGFYLSEFVATLLESKRSDFWMYVWHHFCTLSLIVLSYIAYDIRVGSSIFFVHDIPDFFLSGAKVLHYMKLHNSCNVFFIGLVASYLFFRLFMFPGIIYTGWVLALTNRVNENFNGVNLLLLTFGLLPLHFVWYWMIIRVALKALRSKSVEDIRSDSEDDDDKRKQS